MTLVIAAVLSGILVIVDQLTKAAVVAYFGGQGFSVTVIPGVLSLCHVENTGAGFSIFSGKTVFLILFTAAAMAFILYLMIKRRYKHPLTDWGFCLVLAGGVGNMIDRVFRGGAVVDFIRTDFINFPVFNVADICVTVGAGLIILYFILDAVREGKKKNAAPTESPNGSHSQTDRPAENKPESDKPTDGAQTNNNAERKEPTNGSFEGDEPTDAEPSNDEPMNDNTEIGAPTDDNIEREEPTNGDSKKKTPTDKEAADKAFKDNTENADR